MRSFSKKLISAVVAISSAMTMVMSVSAADYVEVPSNSKLPGPADYVSAPSSSTSSSSSASTSSSETETVAAAVKDAVKKAASEGNASVEVKSTKRLTVSSSDLKALAKTKDGVLEFVAPNATISIDASKIKNAAKVNLSMSVSNSASQTKISFVSKKKFGCEVKVTLTDCKMSAAKLAKAHVYCDGEDMGPVVLDDDGNPVITVTKGGVYTIK